jgi:hypothetical protein
MIAGATSTPVRSALSYGRMSTLSSSASATDAGVDTTSGGRSLLFLAYNNPNYTAQVITVSIDWKW